MSLLAAPPLSLAEPPSSAPTYSEINGSNTRVRACPGPSHKKPTGSLWNVGVWGRSLERTR